MKQNIVFIFLLILGIICCPEDTAMSWIAAAVGTGLGVLSSIYGGIESGKAARKALRFLDKKDAREEAWYRRRYNENYKDTGAGQALVTKAHEIDHENWRKAEGTNRLTGGTDAKVAQTKEAGNKMVGNLLQSMAANDTERKDRIDRMHRASQDASADKRAEIENNRAANITYAAGQASNALMNAGALADRTLDSNASSTVAKPPVTGSVNNNTAAAPAAAKTASAPVSRGPLIDNALADVKAQSGRNTTPRNPAVKTATTQAIKNSKLQPLRGPLQQEDKQKNPYDPYGFWDDLNGY